MIILSLASSQLYAKIYDSITCKDSVNARCLFWPVIDLAFINFSIEIEEFSFVFRQNCHAWNKLKSIAPAVHRIFSKEMSSFPSKNTNETI